jgi:hypothetical protein
MHFIIVLTYSIKYNTLIGFTGHISLSQVPLVKWQAESSFVASTSKSIIIITESFRYIDFEEKFIKISPNHVRPY